MAADLGSRPQRWIFTLAILAGVLLMRWPLAPLMFAFAPFSILVAALGAGGKS
jgi:hypothetical protein